MKKRTKFRELDPVHKAATVVAALVQFSLAAAAWRDLARRPATSIRGRKAVWAGVIAVNFLGPLSYFTLGRLPRR